jgi:hypothetical protein
MPYDNEYNREISKQITANLEKQIKFENSNSLSGGGLQGGFLPFLPMIASALLPHAVGAIGKLITGSGRRKMRHSNSYSSSRSSSPEGMKSYTGGSRLGNPVYIGYPKGHSLSSGIKFEGGGKSGGVGKMPESRLTQPVSTRLFNSNAGKARRLDIELNGAGRHIRHNVYEVANSRMPKKGKGKSGGVGKSGGAELSDDVERQIGGSLLYPQQMTGQYGGGKSGGEGVNYPQSKGKPRLGNVVSGKGKSGGASKWIEFVKKVRAENPSMSYKEAMVEASKRK